MKTKNRFLLFSFSLLLPAVSALAQAGTPAVIVLPQKVVAGEKASLAILDASGALVPGAQVDFEGGERITTDATGRATFAVPALPGN
ncbi:MAG TPA: hypothetical protein VIC04_06015, partial [Terriglobia bacterium]